MTADGEPVVDLNAEESVLGALLVAAGVERVAAVLSVDGRLDEVGGVEALYRLRSRACSLDLLSSNIARIVAAAEARRAQQ